MILDSDNLAKSILGVPRVGGGDPSDGVNVVTKTTCSPRRRG